MSRAACKEGEGEVEDGFDIRIGLLVSKQSPSIVGNSDEEKPGLFECLLVVQDI